MKKTIMIAMLSVLISISVNAGTTTEKTVAQPLIQIALLLDTSNSMDGLIDQAKQQLWKIVNEFVTAKREGVAPEFHVALYEYGNDGLSSKEGYIRLVLPLTTNLDKVSEDLFALKTNGGSEFCGHVIDNAVKALAWSGNSNDLKVIFIAGNEPFTQGGVDYKQSCKSAVEKGITINTIFCGDYQQGVNTSWKDGATRGDGSYMHIDQNRKLVHIDAPQDQEITKLNAKLNKTYIPYGARGVAGFEMQAEQDANASRSAPAVASQRAKTKSSRYYSNEAWDLVDAEKDDNFKLEEVKTKDLPKEMQKMTVAERKQYVEKKSKERTDIQKRIQELSKERDKFVAAERMKLSESGDDTLDAAMIKSIKKQAEQKNFKFE